MIGAVVYRLRAEDTARVPVFHGRWLHGLFFKIMEGYSAELSTYVHETLNVKPFTVSLLKWRQEKDEGGYRVVARGESLSWRVTALREDVLQAALHVRTGEVLQAGNLPLRVEKVKADGTEDSGVVDEMELVGAALGAGRIAELRLRFLSPVAFRRDDKDYPTPDPVFIFSSLADKWQQAAMPVEMDRAWVREAAARALLAEWHGSSRRVYFGGDRGMLAFSGRFSYDVTALNEEEQHALLLLAQFANFSGVGRLTGQGFGETRAMYRLLR